MKKVLLFFVIFFSVNAFSGVVKNDIESIFHSYIQGYEKGDISIVEKVASERYIKVSGGKEKFAKNLKKYRGDYKGVKISKIDMVPSKKNKDHYFVSYALKYLSGRTDKIGQTWFLVVKDKSGKWLIDSTLEDFDPRDPSR